VDIQTSYAKSGDVSIAYQVVGSGSIDLVFVMGWVSNLDWFWKEPRFARFLLRLASFSRLILFDKRGTGLSDRVTPLPTLETRMDDIRAVMDAVDSRRAALLGISEGGPLCALFAGTYPERAAALVMIGSYARRLAGPDYPGGIPREEHQRLLEQIDRAWGGDVDVGVRAPSLASDAAFRQWWSMYLRMSASPGAALALTRMNGEIDIRHILPSVRAPALVIHRTGDRSIRVEAGRDLAERIPGARFVELPGADHLPFVGDQDAILDEIEQFLTGVRPSHSTDRVLATVLYAAPARPVEHATRLGDAAWEDTLAQYRSAVRARLAEFRGQERRSARQALLATFDGPARAIRCAIAVVADGRVLGMPIRAGVHTGECEISGDDVLGVAVHTAEALAESAAEDEILVSGTVKDLVAGSAIQFEDCSPGLRPAIGNLHVFRVQRGTQSARAARPVPEESGRSRLTKREREVAAMVSLGLTNRQIAEELVLSPATAERHVANILNKLGFHSRAQIAAWSVEHGLLSARDG
jgi:pimeloyl-ACP methyl ester carboxylesterase/DNA-binding CsgD family transcriptional regulator